MRHVWIAVLAALLACPLVARGSPEGGDSLVVHEWGTFTSFAGSNGLYLDYRTRIGGDLPEFVLTRQRQAEVSINRPARPKPPKSTEELFIKERIPTLSRMETPVTYFYSDRPMTVQAQVELPRGLLTEFYPPVKAMAPAVSADEKAGKAMPAVGEGMLDWGSIRITPQNSADESTLPAVSSGDRYAAARETDADIVQVTDPRTHAEHQEKFLFYRGVCNFELPVYMTSIGHDRFELATVKNATLAAGVLVQIDHGNVRFTRFTNLAGRRTLELPKQSSTMDDLADAMVKDLAATGLYEKEARAMVATWRTSWFGEDGTRLLYLMPQTFTDGVLPLRITPSPQQTLRVMVGRLETITPEREQEIGESMKRLAGIDHNEKQVADEVQSLGRFAEPALQRVALSTQDPIAKGQAEAILRSLKR